MLRSLPRRLAAIAFACLLLFTAVIAWRYCTWPRPTSAELFAAEIGGRPCQLTTEVFLPRTTAGERKRLPAVVLLHGIEGATRYRWQYYLTAQDLCDQGYVVFLVHYFNSCDYADLWKFDSDGNLDQAAIEQQRLADQQKWVAAVTSAIQEIGRRADVDPQRIAIDGYSLGGFTALSAVQHALEDPEIPDVRCVVCNWGAMFRGEEFSQGYPPTLLIHGEFDNIVERKYAEQTRDELERCGTKVQLYVVPGAKHMASDAKSVQLTQEFLARHLRP